MNGATAIDELIERNFKVMSSPSGVTDQEVAQLMDSYFSNYDALNRAENISALIDDLPDDIDSIADELKREGLVGNNLNTQSPQFRIDFEMYFHSAKQKVLDQILQSMGKTQDGIATYSKVIGRAKELVEQNPQAVFVMVDYFVANAPARQAAAFLEEVGNVLFDEGRFQSTPQYTTLGRATLVYKLALGMSDVVVSEMFVNERFNNAFIKFAGECVKADIPSWAGAEASAYAHENQERGLDSLLNALSNGGYESFVEFKEGMEARFGGLKEEYKGLSDEMKKLADIDAGLAKRIPEGIKGTLFGEACLKAVTRYVKG